MKLLLGRGDVNPDSLDKYGQTPLSLAAMRGHEGIVKLLLGREDVNPDSSSKSGRTPLSWAAENGHEGIAKLLLGLSTPTLQIRRIAEHLFGWLPGMAMRE